MTVQVKIKRFIHFVFIFLLFGGFISCNPQNPRVKAIKGKVDLTRIDFNKHSYIKLDGEWDFFWSVFLPPVSSSSYTTGIYAKIPNVWNNIKKEGMPYPGKGIASYRLKMNVKGLKGQFAIKFFTVSTAFTAYLNGKKIAAAGVVSSETEKHIPAYRPQIAEFNLEGQDSLELLLHVSNFDYWKGGIWRSVYFGYKSKMSYFFQREILENFVLAGSFLVIGLFHIALFFLWNKDKVPLYFGLCCLIVVIRLFHSDEYLGNYFWPVSWYLTIRLEYLSFYPAIFLFGLYITEMYPKEKIFWINRLNLFLLILFLPVVIFLPPYYSSQVIFYYQFISIIYGFYYLFVLFQAFYHRREGAGIFLTFFILIVYAVVNDIMYYNYIINTGVLIGMGLFIFLLSQAYIIAKRFSMAFVKVDELRKELTFQNQNLENIIAEKTHTLKESLEKLTELNKMKDKLFSIISHDFRSPLNALRNTVDLLDEELLTNEEKSFLLPKLKERLLYTSLFLDELLLWAKSQMDGFHIDPKDFLLKPVCEETIQLYKNQVESKKIRLINEIPKNWEAYGDINFFRFVFRNLLSNAIKFTPFEGNIYLSGFRQKGFIKITVRDTGQGIHPDKQSLLFTDQSVSTTGTNGEKGTGLGLLLCKDFVEKNGGQIHFESQEGIGSIFSFTIPASVPKTIPSLFTSAH